MAARYAGRATLGNVIQMATTGLELADYRPDDAEDEVDIRLRLPLELQQSWIAWRTRRSIQNTARSDSQFHFTGTGPKTGTLHPNQWPADLTVEADVAPGYQSDER